MKILLADLFHDYRPNHICLPLNIGFVGSYLKSVFGDSINLELFGSPEKLLKNMRSGTHPDIIGLSNYSWNVEINNLILNRVSKESPDTVVISGGPHIRTDETGIRNYLIKNPLIDFYIMFEGEFPTADLVGEMLKSGKKLKPKDMGGKEIPGVAYLYHGNLVYKARSSKVGEIDLIPSPILNGLLDKFLKDPQYLPILETNRGCPFHCTFCAWGISALSKVRKFDLQRVLDEINYVASVSPASVWFFSDANFGMFQRDVEIALALKKAKESSPSLQRVSINWAKNRSIFCTQIAHILRGICDPLIAVQSTDKGVLKNVKRDNIKENTILDLIEQGRRDGVDMTTDVLVGLSGESYQSHLNTLRDVFDLGFKSFNMGPIRMLPGSEMETDLDRSKFKIQTKYRFISGFSGVYDGEPVCEYEESVVGTADLSQEEMYKIRLIHFFCWSLWNSGLGQPLLRYLHKTEGINPLDSILSIIEELDTIDGKLGVFIKSYLKEARQEWFDSAEELILYFKKNSAELLANQYVKINLKYLGKMILNPEIALDLLKLVAKKCRSSIKDQLVSFCFERIFFIGSRTYEKRVLFSRKLQNELAKIYPQFENNHGEICVFRVTDKFFRAIEADLKRFDFASDQERAMTLTLQNYGNKLTYEFKFVEQSIDKDSVELSSS